MEMEKETVLCMANGGGLCRRIKFIQKLKDNSVSTIRVHRTHETHGFFTDMENALSKLQDSSITGIFNKLSTIFIPQSSMTMLHLWHKFTYLGEDVLHVDEGISKVGNIEGIEIIAVDSNKYNEIVGVYSNNSIPWSSGYFTLENKEYPISVLIKFVN